MNTEKFNSLSKTQQTDLLEAFAYANKKMIDYVVDFNKNAMNEIVNKYGGVLTPMTPEFTEQIRAVGLKLANSEKWTKILGKELIEKMYPKK
jgi:TRAP-type C4-dicarboxylate transport system substrate-binding protein